MTSRYPVSYTHLDVYKRQVLNKLGFCDEGMRRRVLYVDGAWRDHRSFALTAEDLDGESLVHRWNLADASRTSPPRGAR